MKAYRITLAELQEMATDEVAKLRVDQLQSLVEEVTVLLKRAKSLEEKINAALDLKFSEQAKAARGAAGKDTGRVRLEGDDFEVIADAPRAVVWDQGLLGKIAVTIRDEWKENPADYLTIKYGVAESKFTAWPPTLQKLFALARMVKTGKPSYEIVTKKKEAA